MLVLVQIFFLFFVIGCIQQSMEIELKLKKRRKVHRYKHIASNFGSFNVFLFCFFFCFVFFFCKEVIKIISFTPAREMPKYVEDILIFSLSD